MPLYEYECNRCKNQFDKILNVNDCDKKQICPKCKSKQTIKIISKSNFELKGTGWYKTGGY